MYQVTIKGKGAMVDAFREEGIFVTFGDNAPDTLKDFCYSIDVNPVDGEVTPGCKLVIDGKEFYILDFIRRFFASYTKAYTNICCKLRCADYRNDFPNTL